MGYTAAIMATTVANLDTMQHDFGQLISMFQEDAQNLVRVTGDLLIHDFQGPKATSLDSMALHYETIINGSALDRLKQLALICKTYQQAIETACETFDSQYPAVYSDFMDLVFASYGSDIESVPTDLPKGEDDVKNALPAAQSDYRQQFRAKNPHFPAGMMYEIDDDLTTESNALTAWASALDQAFTKWQTALNGADVKYVDVPTFSYDNGNGQLVPMPIDPKYEGSLTNAFDNLDPNAGTSSAAGIESLTPEAYLQMIQVYPDPHTQEVLKVLASTPTGRQFADYYIYMGQKLGPNFISWAHSGPNVGAQTTDGGFVVMNLDDSMATRGDFIELAGDLVHEGVESYFCGCMGIRQMGTKHADYVAEWYQGKFMQEAGGTDSRAYQMTYTDWWNNQLSIEQQLKKQTPPGHNVYLDEPTDVTIYQNSSVGIDRPGTYWSGNGDWSDFWGDGFNLGTTTVTGIPNPMGLDPRMLKSTNLNGPLPQLPPPPPQPRTPRTYPR